jgi:Flagellar biosynthesis protein, FliO
MRTALPRAKTQPALVSPAQELGTAKTEPKAAAAPRSARNSRMAGQRRPAVRHKRTPARRPGLTLAEWGHRMQAALAPAWQFLTLVLRPLRLRCSTRRLRVLESLSLGNKQTVALVKVDGEDFLIGGTASAVVLLARLESQPDRQVNAADVQRLAASFYSKVQ